LETLTKLQGEEIETEIQRIIAELDVALSFLREANETFDKHRQRRLIKSALIAHQRSLDCSLAWLCPFRTRYESTFGYSRFVLI
jgi:hypothetical protein